MADIVRVLEAFEARQRIATPTVFQIVKHDIAGDYFIRVIFPDGTRDAIYSFETASKAQEWIDKESRVWLAASRARPPEAS